MPSGYEVLLAVHVLARMKAAPNIVSDAAQVRRAHRTLIPRLDGYSVHVVDGNDAPSKARPCERKCDFTVSLFARSDLGPTVVDALKVEVNRRLGPEYSSAWPDGVVVNPGRITIDTNIADKDAVRVDMQFDATYPTRSEWSLELA